MSDKDETPEGHIEKAFWQTFHDDIEANNKKITELEKKIDTIPLAPDRSAHERIDELEKNCEVSFAKVEDHNVRILKVIDTQTSSIDLLVERIEKLENAKDQIIQALVPRDYIEKELKELKIRCTALEGVFLDDFQKEIKELKEHSHNTYYNGITLNTEVLREDYKFKIKQLPDNELKEHYKGLLAKLGGEKCSHEWEMREPDDLKGSGHTMAFCKKCGYLRDSKPPSYEDFLMMHEFDKNGNCKKCGVVQWDNRFTPCNPAEQDVASSASHTDEECNCKMCRAYKDYGKKKEVIQDHHYNILTGKLGFEKKEVARQTEKYCWCCGSSIEDRVYFCKPCFIEAQETPEGYILVAKEDLEEVLDYYWFLLTQLKWEDGDYAKTHKRMEKKYFPEEDKS